MRNEKLKAAIFNSCDLIVEQMAATTENQLVNYVRAAGVCSMKR